MECLSRVIKEARAFREVGSQCLDDTTCDAYLMMCVSGNLSAHELCMIHFGLRDMEFPIDLS